MWLNHLSMTPFFISWIGSATLFKKGLFMELTNVISAIVGGVSVLIVQPLVSIIKDLILKQDNPVSSDCVKSVDLERKHREILDDAEKKFASLSMVNDLKCQFNEIKQKIDQIYDFLLERKLP